MLPFSLISKYLSKTFLISFLFFLLVLTGIISLFDVIDLLRRTAPYENITFQNVLYMALLKAPRMIHLLLPFAILFSSLSVFWRLTKTSELVIVRAIGVSVWGFITPLLFATFLIGILDVAAINPLSVSMIERFNRQEEKLGLVKGSSLSWSPRGFWMREIRENKPVILRSSTLKQKGKTLSLENLSIFELSENEILKQQLESSYAVLEKGFLNLYDVWIVTPGKASEKKDYMTLPTTLTVEQILENFETPETVSFWNLPQSISFLEASGFSSIKHRSHFYGLLAYPFSLLCMVLIAAVFGLNPNQRQGKILFYMMGAVVCGFLFFFTSKVISAFGLSQTLPLSLSILGPILITLPLCISLLLHKEDG